MKPFKEVESIRRGYHADVAVNSVHRSSLLVPEIEGSTVEISFLNHFLIKRNYPNVACRVTAVDPAGKHVATRLYPVTEPKVYRFNLSELFNGRGAGYVVEFFGAENLFIPFPAVMINHYGPDFVNSIHSYNRVLNDIFEEDAINGHHVQEASIDVRVDADTDTFCLLAAGFQPCRGQVVFDLLTEEKEYHRALDVDVPRMTSQLIPLRQVFGNSLKASGGILRITQPPQFMFYGRMLAGQRKGDGAFSGNHSYYDRSTAPEYWDDPSASERIYPFMPGLKSRLRIYPIMSPGTLRFAVRFFDWEGKERGAADLGALTSPSRAWLDISLNETAAGLGLHPQEIGSFALSAEPDSGHTPTRISHQLVYSDGALESSICVALANKNDFQGNPRQGKSWGQLIVGGGYKTRLAFCQTGSAAADLEIDVSFYSENGKIAQRKWRLPSNAAYAIDVEQELRKELSPALLEDHQYLWYYAASDKAHFTSYFVTTHCGSRHCTGEHSF